MKRIDQQSFFRRFFASRLFLIIGSIISLLFASGYGRAYYQDYKLKQEIRKLEEQVRMLESKKIESLSILEYVMSDGFVEDTARTELHLKKPGEKVMVVQGIQAPTTKEHSIAKETGQPLRNPIKWWYYFLKKPLPESK